MQEERTRVAIVGAGPAGMLLAHLLDREGVESVVIESRSQEHVASRIRAGILEQSTVDLLREVGLGDRLEREGDEHRGIHLQWQDRGHGERHHVDFVDLTGRTVWVYGQTEVQKDLVAAARARGQAVRYDVADTTLHDLDSDSPSVTFTTDGQEHRLRADVVVGCDGSFGPSRSRVPDPRTWERTYPYSWLGILADVAPSTDELVYAWHPDGFALHSMRSPTVSRFYLQVPNDTTLDDWSDDRLWDALSTRFALDGWTLKTGPVTDRSCCRCARSSRPRCGTDGCSWPATRHTSSRPPAPRGSTWRWPTSPSSHRRWSRGCARTIRLWPTPTPTRRCAGSGAAPTSRGG